MILTLIILDFLLFQTDVFSSLCYGILKKNSIFISDLLQTKNIISNALIIHSKEANLFLFVLIV